MAHTCRHLPYGSSYHSLITLLSTPRTNEDIQSELIEILGFEGEGLMLTEELLKPGARRAVVQEAQGGEDDSKVGTSQVYLQFG